MGEEVSQKALELVWRAVISGSGTLFPACHARSCNCSLLLPRLACHCVHMCVRLLVCVDLHVQGHKGASAPPPPDEEKAELLAKATADGGPAPVK